MIAVQPATADMFPRVLALLREFNAGNPSITESDWRGLFEYPWRNPEDPLGFVIEDGGEIVGYLGAICSRRVIRGREEKICNITSWVTRQSHRQHSLLLLTPVLKLEGYTIVNHTPAKHVAPWFVKFGFQPLETRRTIFYPVPQAKSFFRPAGFSVTTSPERIAARLTGAEAQIFHDHARYQCGHLLIHNREKYCYALFTRTKGRRFHFAHVHHISDPEIFFANLDLVRVNLPFASRAFFTMVESRFCPRTDFPQSRTLDWNYTTLFKSATLKPADIDGLYSELILLHL